MGRTVLRGLLAGSTVIVATHALLVPAALAQTTTTAAVAEASESLSQRRVTLATFAFLLGLILVAMVLAFLYQDRKQTTQVVQTLGLAGVAVSVTSEPATEAAGELESATGRRKTLTISGTSPIEVGKPTEFVVSSSDPSDDPVAAQWTTSDATVSGPVTAAGSKIAITAVKSGQFTLKADADGFEGGVLTVTAVRLDSGGRRAQLSFLGSGWGTVVVGLAVAAITAALGIASVISGETVGVILGAIVGYAAASSRGSAGDTAPDEAGGLGDGGAT